MAEREYQCCIAGGGPAGIMLGYLLARAGIKVLVLEKHPDFLRDFRGDTIHPSTMEVLHELDLLPEFLRLPHEKMEKARLQIGDEQFTFADLTRLRVRTPYIAFIPQWDFLNFLVDAAKEYPEFNLLMETEVVGLIEEHGAVIGVRAVQGDQEREFYADLIIGADGRSSVVRKEAGLEVVKRGSEIDVLWFKLEKRDTTERRPFGYLDHGKMMVMIDRGDYYQCAFVISKDEHDRIEQEGLAEFREKVVHAAPFTGKLVDQLTDWDEVHLLRVTVDYLKQWHRPGLLCIGDAAHAMSPLGGVGINLAIQDAVAAANVLVPAFRRGTPSQEHLAKIQRRREFPTHMTQRLQIMMQNRLLIPQLESSGPTKVPTMLKVFQLLPPLRWIPARFVGLGFRAEHIEH